MNGYINSDGEEIIPCMYSSTYKFTHGLAAVYAEEEDEQGKSWSDQRERRYAD